MEINDEKVKMSNDEVINFTLKSAVALNLITDEKAKEYKKQYEKSSKLSKKMVADTFFQGGLAKFIGLMYTAFNKGEFVKAINVINPISDIFSELFKREGK